MTRQDIIAYGQKRHGKYWIAKLAKELNYSVSGISKVVSGEIPGVSRRLELEMKALIRREQMKALTKPDVRY